MIKINNIKLIKGDCLEKMKDIQDKSISMILCDLPYGTTSCHWDSIIPFELLWEQYERIIKDQGAIVLFGSQPFTSELIHSNLKLFKYCWVWKKTKYNSGFANAKNKPLKKHEDIVVFSKGNTAHASQSKNRMIYNPQGLIRKDLKRKVCKKTETNGARPNQDGKEYIQEYTNYPTSILEFDLKGKPIHPCQKPLELCEYLITTYSNEGNLVLDNTMGSCSTGIACLEVGNRDFIGIELDSSYFETCKNRVNTYINDNNLQDVIIEIAE